MKSRLAIGAVVTICLALALIWISLLDIFANYVGERYETEMSVLSDNIASNVVFADNHFKLAHEPQDPRFSTPAGGRYWQISAEGQDPIRSGSLWDVVVDPAQLSQRDPLGFQRMEGPDGEMILVYAARLQLSDAAGAGNKPFYVYTAFPMSELTRSLDDFLHMLTVMISISAAFMLISAMLLATVGLRPLDRLYEAVADIRAGRTRTMTEDVPTETLPLVREINLLLDEKENAVERARARASDLAHGLKTPLTVLAHLAQKLPPEDRETALKQVDLIRQRSDRQLQSARLGVEQMSSTRVCDITMKLAQVLKPVTSTKGLVWTILIDPEIVVATDPADLAEAIGNVLDNACKWATSRIVVNAMQVERWTDILIADDGPGTSEANYERILKRGGYLGFTDDATGLGLAISSDIAAAYGGSLSLARARIGGLEVCLRFPTSSAEKTSPA
jgi:signal transduction histidine kinase